MKVLRQLFKKQDEVIVTETIPASIPEPQDPEGYQRRGYAYYSRGEYLAAEADFKAALKLDPKTVDSAFALGLTYKMQKRPEEGIQAFQHVVQLIEAGAIDGKSRKEMLRRLAKGHINEMSSGDWNLEKEIWQKIK